MARGAGVLTPLLCAALLSVALALAPAVGPRTSGDRGAESPPGAVLEAVPLAPAAASARPAALAAAWQAAPPLDLSLEAGQTDGIALTVQLRAIYSPETLYLWLRWPDGLPATPAGTQQRATVTWRRETAIGGCAVACHTSFSTGQRISNLQLVAPDVTDDAMTVLLGEWRDGWWTLGYSRALVTASPLEVQFTDLGRAYPFGLDIAGGPRSAHSRGEEYWLRFQSG